MMILGLLLGKVFILTFMLGFLVACGEIMIGGIIRGSALENARIFNDCNSKKLYKIEERSEKEQ